MSLTTLKIIAYITMLIDHIGCATGNIYMRLIGRLAFPIFAYIIAIGAANTKNKWKYARNLLIAGLISEIPYNLFNNNSILYPEDQNVMFTLLCGLLVIYMIEKMKENKKAILYSLPLSLLFLFIPELISSDYGAVGALLIVLLYLAKRNPFLISFSVLLFGFLMLITAEQLAWGIILFFAIISIPFLIFHKSDKKPKHYKAFKISSYLFYPLHLLLLALIF